MSISDAPAPASAAAPAARRGRPRSRARDAAILDATLDLLGREGYARMSMDGIAAAAGVSKATIYLRYRSKADVATAALAHLREVGAPTPTGDLRTDMVAQLRQLRRNAQRVGAMALVGTCLMEEAHTPELLRLFRERTLTPRRAILREMLTAARERGEVAPDGDLETAISFMMGACTSHHLAGVSMGAGWEERIVDAVLRGLRPGG